MSFVVLKTQKPTALGPYDGRKRRRRCAYCSKSHFKCSGEQPCSNCDKRMLVCSYPTNKSQLGIVIDSGTHETAKSFQSKRLVAMNKVLTSPRVDPIDSKATFVFFFDVFAEKNNLTGRLNRSLADDVKQVSSLHDSSFLLDAILSVGALQRLQLLPEDSSERHSCCYMGLFHYSQAIVNLRGTLTTRPPDTQRVAIIWTTLLLGIFELMNEATGEGWLQHMIHGTARGIHAAGPSLCKTKQGQRIFMHARMFEVCRTILFNESTFLTDPAWAQVSRKLWQKGISAEWRPLDSLLDIMVMISSLCVRAAQLRPSYLSQPVQLYYTEAKAVAVDGNSLREALRNWHMCYVEAEETTSNQHAEDECNMLSSIFYAAISIYLSGIFDYNMDKWTSLQFATPDLETAAVETHVCSILDLVELALNKSSLSPLLFLFPLRIAGARSHTKEQQGRVLKLVSLIGQSFVVASTIESDLVELWSERNGD